MPSFQALAVACTSLRLLEQASGVRSAAPSSFARCNYDGPQGGPPFHIGLNMVGYQPLTQDCDFICKGRIQEFNTGIMPKVFDAKFVPYAGHAGGGAFCKCMAHGGSRTIIKFHENKDEHCQPSDCWRKYLLALNFKYSEENMVSPGTLRPSCTVCLDAAECADESSLVHVDELANHMLQPSVSGGPQLAEAAVDGAPAWDAAMIKEFLDAMHAERIILAGDNSTDSTGLGDRGRALTSPLAKTSLPDAAPPLELGEKGPCDPKTGPFPGQCLVVPGAIGNEWVGQLTSQGCTGNQFVVQLQDGVALAITVLTVENLLGAEYVYAPPRPGFMVETVQFNDTVPFTYHFFVRAEPEGVQIGFPDVGGVVPPLDYAVSGSDVQVVLAYTEGLLLQPSVAQVELTQTKPEQVKANYMMSLAGLRSYTHTPVPPNILQVAPLDPSSYADACEPTSLAVPGLGTASYAPPYPMP